MKADLACPNGCVVFECKGVTESCRNLLDRAADGDCPHCGMELEQRFDLTEDFALLDDIPVLDDPNPHLSRRSKYLSREMTAWSYSSLRDLFDGDEEYALYMREADHRAVFFHHADRCWLVTLAPGRDMSIAAPEIVEDWIGSLAEKEHGAEPVLMHRDELPSGAQTMIEYVEEGDVEHPYERC